MQKVDMNQIVGTHHILFVCIDSLRYDVALEEWQNGGTPVWAVEEMSGGGQFYISIPSGDVCRFFSHRGRNFGYEETGDAFFLRGHWHGQKGAGGFVCVFGRDMD